MKRNLLILTAFVIWTLAFPSMGYGQAYAPSVQASNVAVTYKSSTGTGATISWNRGNGNYCIVVLRKSGSTHYSPPGSTTTNYSASGPYIHGLALIRRISSKYRAPGH